MTTSTAINEVLFLCTLLVPACAYNNGLGATPQMGWNSWNSVGGAIDERTAMEMADGLIASGLRDIGYVYLCLDDGVKMMMISC